MYAIRSYYAGTIVSAGDELVWTPANVVTQNTSGDLIAPFTIKAKDANGALSSTVVTVKVGVDDLNMAPTITGTQAAVTYTENGSALAVMSALTVKDPDVTTTSVASIIGAVVSVDAEGVPLDEDTLVFVNTTKLEGTYVGGVLTISLKAGVSGVTAAEMTTALKSIKYQNSSDNPDTTDRTVTYTVTDNGSINSDSNAATSIIHIKAVNDAPVFGGAGSAITLDAAAQEGQAYTITYNDLMA